VVGTGSAGWDSSPLKPSGPQWSNSDTGVQPSFTACIHYGYRGVPVGRLAANQIVPSVNLQSGFDDRSGRYVVRALQAACSVPVRAMSVTCLDSDGYQRHGSPSIVPPRDCRADCSSWRYGLGIGLTCVGSCLKAYRLREWHHFLLDIRNGTPSPAMKLSQDKRDINSVCAILMNDKYCIKRTFKDSKTTYISKRNATKQCMLNAIASTLRTQLKQCGSLTSVRNIQNHIHLR
jgi:hypothetical protein